MKKNYRFLFAKVKLFFQSLLFRLVFGYFLLVFISNIILNWSGLATASLADADQQSGFYFFGYQISLSVSFWLDFVCGIIWLVLVFLVFLLRWVRRRVGGSNMQTIWGIIFSLVSGIFSLIFGGMIYGLIGFLILSALTLIISTIPFIWEFVKQTFLRFG